MLYRNDEALEQLKLSNNEDLLLKLQCWKRQEQEYNLYVFSALFENELDLKNTWKEITDAIAVYFQSDLEKDIEIWNIYILFLVKTKVSRDLKYEVEQDKYSTRKIVIDNFHDTTGNYEELIESRLFTFKLPEQTMKEKDNNESLIEMISKNNKKLYGILKEYPDDLPRTQLVKYLG